MTRLTPGRGRRPHQYAADCCGVLCTWSALVVGAVLVSPAIAQPSVPLTLAEAERLALEAEPGREVFLARAQALRERSVAAGQLLDPQARIGLMNFPIESGGFSTEGMTQVQLGIRQDFPPGQSRMLRTQRLQAEAEELTASAGGRDRDVRAAVRHAWLDAYYWTRATAIVSESRAVFVDLAVITQSLFAVGRRKQQDVLQAELELSRLDDRLLSISTHRLAARAALGQWVGTAHTRPLPASLPHLPAIPNRAELAERVAQHPALRAADARIQAQQHAVDLARARFKPGWMLDLGYGYRDGMLPTGEPRSDFVSLMVTVDLPLFRRNRQSRELGAALQERRAAEESKLALSRRLASELQREYDRWQLLTRRIDGYDERILPQAEDSARAALAAYQSEAGDLSEVLRGYIDQLEARLDHTRLQVEQAQSFALLANLGGIEP